MVMAATIPYFTIADLERFPHDGNRYELLDGVLLVTAAPSFAHETVVSRIAWHLANAVQLRGHALVLTRGAVSLLPRTHLEPDILVVPQRFPPNAKWHEITEHWLAVEVLSRPSRIYDREFKRDAYLRLGVREVWLVDREDRSVEVSEAVGEGRTEREAIIWRPPHLELEVRVDLAELFAGIE
jgi:Uma2 family endonuclease